MVPPREVVLDWTDVHRDSQSLALALRQEAPFDGLIAVSRGGLVPAAIVAKELDIKLVDTFAVASYDGRTRGRPRVFKETGLATGGRWLVVDDIADTGQTLSLLRNRFPKATMAAVYAKPAGLKAVDLFAVDVEQECWLVFPWDRPPS